MITRKPFCFIFFFIFSFFHFSFLMFFLIFILVCLIFIKPISTIKWEYVLFCLSFVAIQYLIIGETTPVLGAIARYKVPALPFLLIAFLFILDKNNKLDLAISTQEKAVELAKEQHHKLLSTLQENLYKLKIKKQN